MTVEKLTQKEMELALKLAQKMLDYKEGQLLVIPKQLQHLHPMDLATGVGDTTGVTRPDVEGVSTLKPDMRTATTTVDAVPEDVNYITSPIWRSP